MLFKAFKHPDCGSYLFIAPIIPLLFAQKAEMLTSICTTQSAVSEQYLTATVF